jgi:putative NADH-flavin reductase
MRIALFGATGDLGKELLNQGLREGHAIQAFVRNPDKLNTKHDLLEIVPTDVIKDSFDSLAAKIADNDLVISALGTGMNPGITKVYSEGTAKIVQAMQQAKIKRFITVSSCGTDPTLDEPWWFLWLIRRVFINVYVDMARMEERIINAQNLEWIIVRPTRLTNGEHQKYRVNLTHSPKNGVEISRADVAQFILEQLQQDTYLYKFPVLSY